MLLITNSDLEKYGNFLYNLRSGQSITLERERVMFQVLIMTVTQLTFGQGLVLGFAGTAYSPNFCVYLALAVGK